MRSMNENHESAVNSLKKLEQALQQAMVSGKNKNDADFKEAYPLIEQYLANKVLFKVVLETFNAAYGYTLHPPRFRKMLLDERNRRAMTGEMLNCTACGQQLLSAEKMEEDKNDVEGVNHV